MKKKKKNERAAVEEKDFFSDHRIKEGASASFWGPKVAATPTSEHIHRPHHLPHNPGETRVLKRRTINVQCFGDCAKHLKPSFHASLAPLLKILLALLVEGGPRACEKGKLILFI